MCARIDQLSKEKLEGTFPKIIKLATYNSTQKKSTYTKYKHNKMFKATFVVAS